MQKAPVILNSWLERDLIELCSVWDMVVGEPVCLVVWLGITAAITFTRPLKAFAIPVLPLLVYPGSSESEELSWKWMSVV